MMIKVGHWSFEIHVHEGFFRSPPSDELPGTNLFMFAQDLPLRVAPYSRGIVDEEEQAKFRLIGTSDDVEKAVAYLSEIGADRNHDPDEMAEATVRHIAGRLVWFGCLLVDLRDTRLKMAGGVYHSAECSDAWIPRIGRYRVQIGFARGKERIALHIGRVPCDNVFAVAIPDELGGVRLYRAMTRRLDRFDATGPRHWRTLLLAGTLEPTDWDFDFSSYRRRVSAYRDWVARAWGWSGRDLSTTLKTEYFSVYRLLRMHRACAIVRGKILQTLQAFLRSRGTRARIVTPLRTAEEIDEIIARLFRGEISLDAAYKALETM